MDESTRIDKILRQLADGKLTVEAASRALHRKRGRPRSSYRDMVTIITHVATGERYTLKTIGDLNLKGSKLILGRMYNELRELGHSERVAISKVQRSVRRDDSKLPYSREHILKCAKTFRRKLFFDKVISGEPRQK